MDLFFIVANILTLVFILLFAVIVSIKKPITVKKILCPVHKEEYRVGFFVNIFRDPKRKTGLDAETCSHFSGGEGVITCDKDCLHIKEAQELYDREAKKHLESLSRV